MDESFKDYLSRREKALSLFHPQWDLTNEEITASPDLLKRDGTPICIPPSWDLVQKYSGPDDERADGVTSRLLKLCNLFAGDRSEAEFLDLFRDIKLGGVLVGNINSVHFLATDKCDEDKKFLMPNAAREFFKQELGKVRNFEFDYIYFHPTNGILQIEIKSGGDERKHLKQLNKNRDVLKQLFFAYGKLIGLKIEEIISSYERYFWANSIVFPDHANSRCKWLDIDGNDPSQTLMNNDLTAFGKTPSTTTSDKNFKEDIFRGFVILFAGFRPDFYFSPVKCALLLQNNLFTHDINTANYYCTSTDRHSLRDRKPQNKAVNLTTFFASMKEFLKDIVIDFGEYGHFYLTSHQQAAIGCFNACGIFSPTRQLIYGPPGSGKSLILMLKAFILAHLKMRRETRVCYWTYSKDHRIKLAEFFARNQSQFCREVFEFDYESAEDRGKAAGEGADVLFDEELFESHALSLICKQRDPQVIAVVCTGPFGITQGKNEFEGFKENSFDSKTCTVTELSTVFRSTRQIQRFAHRFDNDDNMKSEWISGHCFDGVKVETYAFEDADILEIALAERIDRLLDIDDCKVSDIGLFLPEHYKKPARLAQGNVFDVSGRLRSLEFAVMIVVAPARFETPLAVSRAVCHLILMQTCNNDSEHESLE